MRYRIEQRGKPYRHVDSVDEAMAALVQEYPVPPSFQLLYQKTLEAGEPVPMYVGSVLFFNIVPCKDLAPCPKCGQPMTGLGDECLDCEANYN